MSKRHPLFGHLFLWGVLSKISFPSCGLGNSRIGFCARQIDFSIPGSLESGGSSRAGAGGEQALPGEAAAGALTEGW